MPVLVDSGFRRSTVSSRRWPWAHKPYVLGGPIYLWRLGAFGQSGVERVLEILRTETRAAMQQVGAPSIKHLTKATVHPTTA